MWKVLAFQVLVCFNMWKTGKSQECEKWTMYFNHQLPQENVIGDDEESIDSVRHMSALQLCDEPSAIDVRVNNLEETDYRDAGQVLTLDGNRGFRCLQDDQPEGEKCLDYKVRFCCPAVIGVCRDEKSWSKWYGDGDVTAEGDDETIQTIYEHDAVNTCERPTAIEVRLVKDNLPYMFGYNKLDVGIDHGLSCVTDDQPLGLDTSWLDALCLEGECPESLERFREFLLQYRSETRRCEDYKIRLCCEFTVARLLGDKLDLILSRINPEEAEEEEEAIPSQADSFFQRGESLFSFNDAEDPETC